MIKKIMRNCRFFICFILIILTSIPAFAKTAKRNKNSSEYVEEDLSLREIRALIRQTNYDKALEELTLYIDQNPENFDNAQRLIAIIMDAKKRYADILDRLVNLIATDPDNDEEIYRIIQQLKKIERHPSDASLAYIDNIDKVVTFTHNQKESTRILSQSSEFVASRQFSNAIKVTTEGFSLYREEYEERWENQKEILENTEQIVSDLNKSIDSVVNEDFTSKLDSAILAFNTAVEQDLYSEALRNFEVIKNLFVQLCDFRKQIYESGQQLIALNESLKEIPEESEENQEDEVDASVFLASSDASYLPFMTFFIFGDKTKENSGIIPAIDSKYNYLLGLMNEKVNSQIVANYNEYTDFFKNNIASTELNTQSEVYTKKTSEYVSLQNQIAELNPKIFEYQLDYSPETYENPLYPYVVLGYFAENLLINSQRLYKNNVQLNEIGKNQNEILLFIGQETDNSKKSILVDSIFDSTALIGNLVGVKSEQILENYEWASEYFENDYSNWNELCGLYNQYLDKIFMDSSVILNEGWQRIADFYTDSAEKLVKDISENNGIIKKYSDGFTQLIETQNHEKLLANTSYAFEFYSQLQQKEGDDDILYKYPDVALNMALFNRGKINKNISEIQGYEKVISNNYNNHAQWKSDEGITQLVNNTHNSFEEQIHKLEELRNTSDYFYELSQKQIAAANILKSDASDDFDEASNFMRRERFESARARLNSCVEKYARAFDIQSNEKENRECDEKIQRLGLQINRLENEIVVRDVRELKNKAKAAYSNGQYAEGYSYLTQAAQRWAVTNAEEDSEITNLQVFVRTAMDTTTGREILPSAPQYEEMTQLLVIAYEYYNSGVEKRKNGQVSESNADLDNSEASIKQLQLLYPLHQEAALLNLKISKLRDPKQFEASLAQKIENARMMCKSQDKEIKNQGYNNLKDYYELEPDYKNLKNIIYQAEFDVGIRQVVDNSSITKAKNLYNEANRLFKAGRLEDAKQKIEQALILNSNDKSSEKLKDEINLAIGGTKIPLSTQANRLYNESLTFFNAGRIREADSKIKEIEKLDKRFLNDDQVKRLKENIDAKM